MYLTKENIVRFHNFHKYEINLFLNMFVRMYIFVLTLIHKDINAKTIFGLLTKQWSTKNKACESGVTESCIHNLFECLNIILVENEIKHKLKIV